MLILSAAIEPENIEYSTPTGSAFPSSMPRARQNIPTTSAGAWPFPAPVTAPANGVGQPPTLPAISAVHPPVTNGQHPQYYQQQPTAAGAPPGPGELNPMIGHTNPNNSMNWDPWNQQYY